MTDWRARPLPHRRELEFQFKGQRDYVHGTSICDALFELFGHEFAQFDIKFSQRLSNSRCTLHVSDSSSVPVSACSGRVRIRDETLHFGLQPADENGATARVDYPEDEIVAASQLAPDYCSMSPNNAYTFIENLVALTKAWHLHRAPPKSGQWMFARLELARPVLRCARIDLRLQSDLAGRMTCSDVVVDSQSAGRMYFSLSS